MGRTIKVYLAMPYSMHPNRCTRDAMWVWDLLWRTGYIPYCPHWTHFQDIFIPLDYADWLEFDAAWLPDCHVVLRMKGTSMGADKEMVLATKLGIPVVFSVDELMTRYPADGELPRRENRPA